MDWDNYYTIEYKGSKGWEVVKYYDKTTGINEVIRRFQEMVVNNDGQYRLTTPE